MQQKERGTSSAIKMSCVAFEFSFFSWGVWGGGEVSRRRRVFLGREWGGEGGAIAFVVAAAKGEG